jgi:pectinesterase
MMIPFWIVASASCLALLPFASASEPLAGATADHAKDDSPTTAPAVITLVLAGDSGVTDEHGWGRGFAHHLTGAIKCINLSASGRSSKSFRTDGFWDKVLAAKGDYVLINFGGNDQAGKGPARETDPNTTYRENMGRYVDEVRAYGGKAILVAPMIRRFFDKEGKIHSSLQPYVDALKQLASDKDVPILDLHGRSIALCESIGSAKAEEFAPVKDGKLDRSHLNAAGGEVFGALVADELRTKVPQLAPYIIESPTTEPAQ